MFGRTQKRPLLLSRAARILRRAPLAGTSCVQTLTIGGTPTGGSFTLLFNGQATGAIAWTATDATLESNIANALAAMPSIGLSGVTVAAGTGSSGIGSYTITFAAQNANQTVPSIFAGSNNMTGTSPTIAMAVTTTGVTGTIRGVYAGTEIVNYTNVAQYTNTGSVNVPNWVRSDCYTETIAVTGVTSTSGGGLGTWQPAEGGPILILDAGFLITTVASGAANLSVGQGTSASTSYTNIIAATSVHTETAPFYIDAVATQIIAATAAESAYASPRQVMPAANFLTLTGSATTAGLVGIMFVRYMRYS